MSVVPFPTEGSVEGNLFVAAEPCPWPYDRSLDPGITALVIIDMQTDVCGKGGSASVGRRLR